MPVWKKPMLDHRMKKDYVKDEQNVECGTRKFSSNVLHELDWEPELFPLCSGVEVDEGAATTLTGAVESCSGNRLAANTKRNMLSAPEPQK